MAEVAGLAAINGALAAMVPASRSSWSPFGSTPSRPGSLTPLGGTGLAEEERSALFAQYASAIPVGRAGAAEDVAEAIISVTSNGFIPGTVLTVDAGLTLAAAA